MRFELTRGPIVARDTGGMSEASASEVAREIDELVAGKTAPSAFLDTVERHGDVVALRSRPAGSTDTWNEWTYAQLRDLVATTAAGLRAVGAHPGERVMLMMRNRPEFHWLDIALQFLRATPVSIYNSSSADEVHYLAHHAEAEIAIVEDAGFLARFLEVRDRLPKLRTIYVVDGDGVEFSDSVVPVAELAVHGSADLAALAAEVTPEDIATLIYTSGTTGPPKGVMISQYNVVFTVESLRRCLPFEHYEGLRTVSYLPMAHIAERMVGLYDPMILGFSVHCCPDVTQLSAYLGAVKPQLMFGVPRVWEKIYNGVNAALGGDAERKAKFDDGVTAALAIKQAERDGTVTDEQVETWAFLDAVAFRQVRELVGLDALELGISGAAPIQQRVLEWFNAIGVPLTEIYGMSESSGPLTWSPEANRPGMVGRALPGIEVELADDGEIIARGGLVFQGYHKQPEKTAETLDDDGWLHTGDIGERDQDGYFRIVDRKKELIITSGGKNISPSNLESALRAIPLVGQAAAIGDNRKFVTALLVLDPDAAKVWAASHGHANTPLVELAALPEVIEEVQAGVDAVNKQFANVEQIKRFTLLGEEWLPDSDVLTPTSKLKRRGVNTRYADDIEAMYSDV